MPEKEAVKWYQSKIFVAASLVLSVVIVIQNWMNGRDTEAMRRENDTMRADNARIHHRLDTKQAYFMKGVIDGAKDRESAYFEMKTWGERVLNHCRAMPTACKLPNELTILPQHRQFESLEVVLTRDKE